MAGRTARCMADKTQVPAAEFAFFHAPVMSFYAGDLYRDVAQRWRGSGLLYVFFVAAVLAVPQAARIHMDIGRMCNDAAIAQAATMPMLSVKDGVLSVDHEQP